VPEKIMMKTEINGIQRIKDILAGNLLKLSWIGFEKFGDMPFRSTTSNMFNMTESLTFLFQKEM
jgi:hypothetical protein